MKNDPGCADPGLMFALSPSACARAVAASAATASRPAPGVARGGAETAWSALGLRPAAEPRAPLPGSRSICICAVGVFRSVE